MTVSAARRVLFVHAHPDDEVLATGATMAKYAAAPDTHVTLVTCTLGEIGEVLVPELVNLRFDKDDQLGGYRIGELDRACQALGVADHRFLGAPGKWRDSGMMDTKENDDPRCLWQAEVDDPDGPTGDLVRVIREIRPQVLVTYDANGGYGHPDHIRAHQITTRAFDAAADPDFAPAAGGPWSAAKLYHTALPKSALQAGMDHFREVGRAEEFFGGVTSVEDIPMGVPDDQVTTQVDGGDFFDAKMAAMRAHATQIEVDGFFYALADGAGQRAWGTEHYTLARGDRGPGDGQQGRETDLFAGL